MDGWMDRYFMAKVQSLAGLGDFVPPEKKTLGKISFQSTKSGAGEQFLLQDCMAKAPIKGVCLS